MTWSMRSLSRCMRISLHSITNARSASIELIVRRSVTAEWAFRSLLKDMRTVGPPAALLASPLFTVKSRACGD